MSQTPNYGAGNSSRENIDKWNILYGRFATQVSADTEGSESRVNKNGDTVHEVFCDQFVGHLRKIHVMQGKHGYSLVIDIAAGPEDNATQSRLFLNLYSMQGRQFLNFILNVQNIHAALKFSLSTSIGDDQKVRTSFFIAEWKDELNEYDSNWHGVKFAHQKHPDKNQYGTLPEIKKISDGQGGEKKDYGPMTKALLTQIISQILPEIQTEKLMIEPRARDSQEQGQRTQPPPPPPQQQTNPPVDLPPNPPMDVDLPPMPTNQGMGDVTGPDDDGLPF